jgi:hypothetical protein
MKIKRFNENIQNINLEYIDECFAEFLDNTEFEKDEEMYRLFIPAVKSDTQRGFDNRNDIRFLKTIEMAREIILDVQVCLEKVKLRYPDIEYMIDLGDDACSRNFNIEVMLVVE